MLQSVILLLEVCLHTLAIALSVPLIPDIFVERIRTFFFFDCSLKLLLRKVTVSPLDQSEGSTLCYSISHESFIVTVIEDIRKI